MLIAMVFNLNLKKKLLFGHFSTLLYEMICEESEFLESYSIWIFFLIVMNKMKKKRIDISKP